MKARAKKWAGTVTFVMVCLVCALTLWVNDHQDNLSCERQQENREVIRTVVDLATAPRGAQALDFSAVPGFPELDVETQVYLIALGEALAAQPESAGSLRNELLASIPDIIC